jgi:hypothetical protein
MPYKPLTSDVLRMIGWKHTWEKEMSHGVIPHTTYIDSNMSQMLSHSV